VREALPPDAVFSDTTAALLHDLPAQPATRHLPLHITVSPRPYAPRRRELVAHRRQLAPEEICSIGGLPVTTPERTFVDLAMSLHREELVAVGDALLRSGLADLASISHAMKRVSRRRGLVVARTVLPVLDGRAQSRPESLLRVRLTDGGMPPVPQCPVFDRSGRVVGHADLGYEEEMLAVEYEGRHHSSGEQFDYDIERYSRFAAAGWLVIRCGRRDLAEGSGALITRVRDVLDQRGRS
jgi:hypothetical protein